VNPSEPVSVSISTNPSGAVCSGTVVTYTAIAVNGGTVPVYVWRVDGTVAGTNSSTLTYTPLNGNVVTCEVTSNAICPTGNPALSNAITMSVSANLPVSVMIVSDQGNMVCSGTMVTYTATIINGGSAPAYQWKVDGTNAGTNASTFTYIPGNGETITCTLTSNEVCTTGNPVLSNSITMIVNTSLMVGVSITASPSGAVCSGTAVTFTALPVNGGSSPSYLWKVNAISTGITSSTYTYLPSNGEIVTCNVTSSITCAIGNPASSNAIVMVVNPNLPVAVAITASPSGPVCAGTLVTFTAAATNGGTSPSYQWKVNSLNAGTDNSVFNYIPVTGDVVSCIVTSNVVCPSGNPATSNLVTMTVNPTLPVSISIAASANPVCAGTQVIYTAIPVNGGSFPIYFWTVNGVNQGTNSSIFNYTPVNGDIIICQLTSDATCPIGNPANSNAITMVVNPTHPVSISISSSPSGAVCAGTPVTYTANIVNGGSAPFYQWKVGGANFGTNSSTVTYTPANGNVISCELASNVSCPTGNPATSNSIIMNVLPVKPVSVIISASPSEVVCAGTIVTLTATGMNGGPSPTYLWLLNGLSVGVSSPTYSLIPIQGDVVTCLFTSSDFCITGSPATSNSITFTVNPNLPVSVSIADAPTGSVCAGTPVSFTAIPLNGGSSPSYQWRVNGGNAGTGSSVYTYNPLNGDNIECIFTSNATCVTGNPATSNSIVKAVNPAYIVGVSVAPDPATVCPGATATFTATAVNGGTVPVYQWKVNGINAGTNSSTYTFTPVNPDIVTCELISNLTCTTGNPASSNPVAIILSPSPVVTVTPCNDMITTTDAKPFKLKGGLPLGGTYSGAGINSVTGVFDPAIAGAGSHPVTYSYTNVGLCTSTASLTITVNGVSPFTCGSPLTDPRDNQSYPTVLIGTQCWFAGNLNYGNMLITASSQVDNCQVEKFCPNDMASWCNTNGGFYQWDELMCFDAAPGNQGLCPPGWHVPTSAEWVILMNNYDQQSRAGDSLKTIPAPNGFNAMLSGILYQNNTWSFSPPGLPATFFWTSDASGPLKAMSHGLNSKVASVSDYPSSRANGMQVRCLKN